MRAVLLLCLMLAPLAWGADIQSKIGQLIAGSPALSGAFVGLEVLNLSDGKILYQLNSDHLFVPASNMKLFTSALALERLGPEYRFRTEVRADRPVDAKGTLAGDLVFVGGGDPSLSGRSYPYRYRAGSTPGADYSFRAVEELAGQLVSRGLKRVDGDIVGDDRRYVWEPHAGVWSTGDATWDYGAPVSALIVDDNSLAVTLVPAASAGELAQVRVSPAFEYFSIDNRVRTVEGGERKVEFERQSGRQLHIWGTLPIADPGVTQLLAVDDPALYAAEVLRDALQRRGVAIRGRAFARHRFSDDGEAAAPSQARVILAERTSPPLAELLEVLDKESQNLHAEVMLREVGFVKKHAGSRETGLAEMREFLENEAGIPKDSFLFTDGSGVSRSTLVKPEAIAGLLAYMYKSSHRELWMSLLPIAGADGTLAKRFEDRPEARAIHAKTGTLAHVRAISGYVTAPQRDPLGFSLLVNNYDAPAAEITRALDRIVLALLE
ncbi:MAG: D-alanyl-D-alanine carboxypeptidase/D-alanyl-D-alanine-endopeptidase [Acidobacteriia bacterium]|nr:D-alanyl-D-alanine carboxypeptidase/D-alanyl-D-alanine-endopeptidase [Terriglobia bacterium]